METLSLISSLTHKYLENLTLAKGKYLLWLFLKRYPVCYSFDGKDYIPNGTNSCPNQLLQDMCKKMDLCLHSDPHWHLKVKRAGPE